MEMAGPTEDQQSYMEVQSCHKMTARTIGAASTKQDWLAVK